MASPHTPYHPQPGPSYYHHPPPPPPPHYAYSPAPAPAPYYPYPMPPMNGHVPMHQPASPRVGGVGRGRYNPHRGGAPAYHYQPIPPQHHIPPHAVPVQTPPPVSPASPFHHPQKYPPHPQAHQVPYGSPYHHPQPNGPYPHAWQGQAPSPLPKQLSMLPPMVTSEQVPQVQQQQQQPHHTQPPLPPPAEHPQQLASHAHVAVDVPPVSSLALTGTISQQVELPRTESPLVGQVQIVSPDSDQPVLDTQPEPSQGPEPVSQEAEEAQEQEQESVVAMEHVAVTPSRSPSPAVEPTPALALPTTYVIWSRRPGHPNRAPGVIISTRAFPPDEVLQNALETRTPPASPRIRVAVLPHPGAPTVVDAQEASSDFAVAPSSSTTETTPACSVAADTPVPGSPYSSATSVSAVVGSPSTKAVVSPHADSKMEFPTTSVAVPEVTEPSTPQPIADQAPAAAASTSAAPGAPAKPAPGPKKSWASLLQPSDASASSSKSRLPVSNVVGFSIPATVGGTSSTTPRTSVASANRNELLRLLNEGPSGSAVNVAAAMKIRPRGLINSGNMCFANAVLQILVYCPPFHRFFSELRRHLAGPVVGSQREGTKATPLVDATIQFLKEFVPDPPAPSNDPKAKGKEREDDAFDELESFIPTYVYDAMKEKKRFANMIGGHQEDAEEFLGFFLDTLEEELLSISQSLQPKEPAPAAGEDPSHEDGWLEVGKKNKAVATRTAKSTDSPITRIFGGKFRSALRAPHQRESVTIEDWRSLQLDIQPEDVKTLRDALQHISHPQTVQVSIPTRPGAILDATQQVLIEALPPVLIMHMKRFHYDIKVNDVVKVGKQVSFSPELDIPPEIISPAKRTAQPVKYQLFGVLYHHGMSASGGHYTLDVLHPNRELTDRPRAAWIRIDDELVSDVRPEDVFGGQDREDRQPYLLFYKRMTAWGPARTS
ncbi:cysteine proteinase [Lentinus tigrinus ALCF2SS1-7]|uniref:Ubiquitin carboxyl-terminal hydrolase n=1 Tax=Lentinus tigrinus ALCF2SS1-6 TaxID=1328759 RepID=A0A5C2SU48_9APHY|nr:cysteine proteinase [Lentinus tigrinus ALCF2SS1-6]RPD80528.1 cysteine proteinase [Lentinus tigrinus ALCF2SS1-7]